MSSTTYTRVLIGLDAYPVRVTAVRLPGLPQGLHITGMADAAARETTVRVVAALASLGVRLDSRYRVDVVRLDSRYYFDGPSVSMLLSGSFALAIAVAVLAEHGTIDVTTWAHHGSLVELCDVALLGDLSFDGRLRPVRGLRALLGHVVPAAFTSFGLLGPTFIIPEESRHEIARPNVARTAPDLAAVVQHLSGARPLAFAERTQLTDTTSPEWPIDMVDLPSGIARRALEIAAAGAHGLLFIGPPGSGKTVYARRLVTILPPLTDEEAESVATLHSVAGLLNASAIGRPFRAPHHTVSETGLLGGGAEPRPGEVSLAHHGVLFLDELPEFRTSTLDALRGALAEGQVTTVRAGVRASFPAEPFLVGAMNPGSLLRRVGRLLDRFDLVVHLPVLSTAITTGETSAAVRARVVRAWQFGLAPFSGEAEPSDVVSRVARTIANLAGEAHVTDAHRAEARTLTAQTASTS